MSSIDERIVQMEFDNSLFDKNVESSIKTLEKLNVALKMDGIDENLSNISSNISRMDFSKVADSIGALENRFNSFLGMLKGKVIGDAVEALSSGIKKTALFIPHKIGEAWNQIMSGGMKRATNIDQARFKIEGLGIAWDKVSEDISYGVQDTAYGFDAAASAASQLAASGVQLGDDMKQALRGISGVAAMTSKSYEEIAPIFTKVAGSGRLFATELNSLSARGINAAATIAKYLDKTGKLAGATEEDVHEMTRKGEIDFAIFAAAMDDAFGEHAKEANRTFEGALDNMKAAMSRIGAEIFTPYRAHMRDIFNSIKPIFDAIKSSLAQMGAFKSIGTFFNNVKNLVVGIFGTIKKNAWVFDIFSSGLKRVFDWLSSVVQMVGSWFGIITDPMQAAGNAITNFFDDKFSKVTSFFTSDYKEAADDVETASSKMTASLEEVDALIDRIWNGEFGNGDERFAAIDAMFGVEGAGKAVQNRLNELANVNFRYSDACDLSTLTTDKQTKSLEKAESTIDSFATTRDKLTETAQSIGETISASFDDEDKFSVIGWLTSAITGLRSTFSMLGGVASSVAKGAISGLISIFKTVGSVLGGITELIFNGITGLNLWMQEVGAFDFIESVFKGIFDSLSNIFSIIGNLLKIGFKGVGTIFGKIGETISGVVDRVKDFWAQLKESSGFRALETAFDGIKVAFEGIKEKVFGGISSFFEDMAGTEIKLPEIDMSAIVGKVSEGLDWIAGKIQWLREGVLVPVWKSIKEDETNPFHGIYEFFSNLTFQGILDSVTGKFTKLKDTVGGFLKETGLATKAQNLFNRAVTGVKNVAPKVFSAVFKIAGKVATAIGNAKDKIVEFWEAFKETEGYQVLKNGIVDTFNNILDFIDSTGSKMTELISSIFGKAEDAAEGFEFPDFNMIDFANSVSEKIEWLKEKIESIKATIKMLFSSGEEGDGTGVLGSLFTIMTNTDFTTGIDGVTESFSKAKEVILDFLSALGSSLFGVDVEAAEMEGVDAVGAVTKELPNATSIIDKMVESVDKAKESIHGFFDEFKMAEDEGTVEESASGFSNFVTFMEALKETAKSIWDEIKPIIDWLIGFGFAKGGIQLMDSLTSMFNSVASIGFGVKGVLEQARLSLKKFGKALAREANSKAIRNVAIAFGILAASLWALSNITPEGMATAIEGIKAITIALAALMVVFGLFMRGGRGKSSKAIEPLESFGVIMAQFGKNLSKSLKKFGTAAVLISFVVAIKILLGAVKEIGEMDEETLMKGVLVVGVLGLFLTICTKVMTSFGKNFSLGKGMGTAVVLLAFVGALHLIVGAIKEIGAMSGKTILKGVIVMTALGLIIKGIVKASSNLRKVKVGPLLGIAAVIGVTAFALSSLAEIDASKLLPAALSLGLVIGAIALMMHGLSGMNAGSIAPAIVSMVGVGLLLAEVAYILNLFASNPDFDADKMLKVSESISLLMGVMGALTLLSQALGATGLAGFGAGVVGTIDIGAVTALMTGIFGLIGWGTDHLITDETAQQIMRGLDLVGQIFEKMGEIVGKLVGGFLGGIFGGTLEGMASSLPSIGTNLQQFVTNLGSLAGDDAPSLSGISGLISTIRDLSAAAKDNIVADVISAWFGDGESALEKLGNGLVQFATKMVGYAGIMKGLDQDVVTSSSAAVDTVMKFANAVPPEGGLMDMILGDSSLATFAKNLLPFAVAMRQYAAVIGQGRGLNQTVIDNSVACGKMLAGLAEGIPESGGWLQTVMGEKDLAAFGKQLPEFAAGLVGFANEIANNGNNINTTATGNAVEAAKLLAAFASDDIVASGGVLQKLLGEKDLARFGNQLPTFGKGLVGFAEAIANSKVKIDKDTTEGVIESAKVLAAFAKEEVPESGGLLQILMGEKNLATFGNQLPEFADGLVTFSQKMADFETGNIDTSISSMQSLLDTLAHFQNYEWDDDKSFDLVKGEGALDSIKTFLGRIMDTFNGEDDQGFAQQIQDFGKAWGRSIADAMVEGVSSIETMDGDVKDTFFAMVDSIFGEGGEYAKGIFEGNGEDLAMYFTDAFGNYINTPGNISVDFSYLSELMKNAGMSAVTQLCLGIAGKTWHVRTTCNALANAAVNAFKGTSSRFRTIGQEWVQGLIDGMASKVSALKMAASSIAQIGENATKEKSEVHSPSKVFARIGAYWVKGLGKGIMDNTDMVTKPLTDLVAVATSNTNEDINIFAEQAASSLAAAYLYINQVVQDSMNSNPVITPVLDLSVMQNGLYAMNGMMPGAYGYNPLAYSMSAFPGSYSYGYSQQAMGQSNLEAELRGLRSDVKALGEAMSTMGITLDSGVMVGALTPGTDRELGNITKFKERWA